MEVGAIFVRMHIFWRNGKLSFINLQKCTLSVHLYIGTAQTHISLFLISASDDYTYTCFVQTFKTSMSLDKQTGLRLNWLQIPDRLCDDKAYMILM